MQRLDLDARDRAILHALQDNARLTNAELAQRVSLSPSACLRRLRALEDSGIIRQYAMLLDEAACGKPGTAFVHITLDQQSRAALDAFESATSDVPEIMDCYLIAGSADYLMRVVYSDAADIERIHSEILTRLPGVQRVQSTLTLRAVKRTTAIEI